MYSNSNSTQFSTLTGNSIDYQTISSTQFTQINTYPFTYPTPYYNYPPSEVEREGDFDL
jgi:hypothetical protein